MDVHFLSRYSRIHAHAHMRARARAYTHMYTHTHVHVHSASPLSRLSLVIYIFKKLLNVLTLLL